MTYYLIPKFLNRGKKSGVVNHARQDNGFSEWFSTSLSIEYKNKIDFMSVQETTRDPTIAKRALNNLGFMRST
jgi:hypothetical protein